MTYAVKSKIIQDFRAVFPHIASGRIAFLQSLPSKHLFLRAPLILYVEYSQKKVLVSSSDFELWGQGDTESEAISDFTRSLEELYFTFMKNKKRLSKILALKLHSLSEFVSKK